jgi:hypothetical protein
MAVIERQVCRIEIDGNPVGTGFLVGPDAVLTNYHVLESVLKEKDEDKRAELAAKVTCRFDYEVLANGSRVEGVEVKLHPTNWNLDASPYSPAERTRTPADPPPAPGELDYALVRLARRVGDESVTPRGGAEVRRRGWLVIPDAAPVFIRPMALMIAQYPDGQPLRLALDTNAVIGVNGEGTRVQYATNTDAGSSGSPVFDLDWNLVALHHLGDPAYDHPPAYNQGVPIDKVRARIEKSGHAGALGGASNRRLATPEQAGPDPRAGHPPA